MQSNNPELHVNKLSAIFSGIGKELSMKRFEDELETQKVTYLIQEYGVDLGYHYGWFIYGPHSKQVAIDARSVYENRNNQQHIDIADEDKIREFKQIMSEHLDDSIWLEIAASLVYLKKNLHKNKPLTEIEGQLINNLAFGYKHFDTDLVIEIIEELDRLKFLD